MKRRIPIEISLRRIEELDLEPPKFKLVHDNPDTWTVSRADSAEAAYKRFLVLALKYPGEQLVPAGDIDIFWHANVLDTAKYAADCEHIFGRFLHHFPYSGLLNEADAENQRLHYARTCELHVKEFGEPLNRASGIPVAEQCTSDCEQCCPDYDCDTNGKLSPLERPRPRLNRTVAGTFATSK